jgi:hypothetical protein
MAVYFCNATGMEEIRSLQADSETSGKLLVLYFWVGFFEASAPGGHIDDLINELSKAHPEVTFAKV